MTMSGFWLEGRYFVTCAHYFQRYICGVLEEERILKELQTGSSRPIYVDSRQISVDHGTENVHRV